MNILIIGNGFDLAHGLPTTYKDFLDFANAFEDYTDKIILIELGKFIVLQKMEKSLCLISL